MTTTSGGYCGYCLLKEGHRRGCPELHPQMKFNPGLMREWNKGCDFGWDDNTLEWWEYRYYSTAFVRGYQVGKALIEESIDQAESQKAWYGEND